MSRARFPAGTPLTLWPARCGLAALASLIVLAGCSDGTTTAPTPLDFPPISAGVAPAGPFCGVATTVPLVAGRTHEIGTVTVENDEHEIVVTYQTSADVPIRSAALYVGETVAGIPQTKSGNPKVGQFPYKGSYAAGTTQVVWRVDRAGLTGETAVIAAYAEVGDGEGAWAAGDPIGPGGSWAMQFTYEIQECAGDGFATIPCPGLSLASTAAMPLDQVALGSLPETLVAPLFGQVSWSGGSEQEQSFVDRAEDGTATLLVPLHPTGAVDGGDVSIRITDGTNACPAVSLHIDALPAAPGEFAAVVDLVQQLIALQAGLVGTSVADLQQADAATLPEYLFPLAIVQSVVDAPDNPNSLRAIAEGTAPFDAGMDLTALDRLMARTGLRAALETALANATAAAGVSVGGMQPGGAAGKSLTPSTAVVDRLDCLANPIQTAQVLSDCMNLAFSAAFDLQGVGNKVLNDISFTMGVAGLVPFPPLQAASAVSGLVIWAYQKVQEGTASLLPSKFVNLKVVPDPTSFQQDEDATGAWTAEVTATSKGWSLDQVALETLLQIAGAKGAYDSWLQRYLPSDVIESVVGLVETTFTQKAIDQSGGTGFLKIAPELFGPVSITDDPWSESLIYGGAVEALAGVHNGYEPVKLGTANLHVGTPQGKGLFGNEYIETKVDPVLEVQPIFLTFLRDGTPVGEIIVKGGDEVHLQVQVDDAKYPGRVALAASNQLAGSASMSYDGGDTYSLTYKAPADISKLPDILTVEDTAHTGSLATSNETPRASLAIKGGDVTIIPGGACIELGDTMTFTADVQGTTDPTVQWHASLGSITTGGKYTAPSDVTPGTQVQISATSVEQPQLSDTITVTVGNCSCRFDMTAAGGINEASHGPAGFYDVASTLVLEFWGRVDAVNDQWVQSFSMRAEGTYNGAPGVYTIANAALLSQSGTLSAQYNPDNGFTDGGGTITIDQVTQDEIKGSFSVTMVTGTPDQGLTPTTATGTFSASRASPPYDGLYSPFIQCKAVFPVGSAARTTRPDVTRAGPAGRRQDRP